MPLENVITPVLPHPFDSAERHDLSHSAPSLSRGSPRSLVAGKGVDFGKVKKGIS